MRHWWCDAEWCYVYLHVYLFPWAKSCWWNGCCGCHRCDCGFDWPLMLLWVPLLFLWNMLRLRVCRPQLEIKWSSRQLNTNAFHHLESLLANFSLSFPLPDFRTSSFQRLWDFLAALAFWIEPYLDPIPEESAVEVAADVARSTHHQRFGRSLLQRSPSCMRLVHVCIPACERSGAKWCQMAPNGAKVGQWLGTVRAQGIWSYRVVSRITAGQYLARLFQMQVVLSPDPSFLWIPISDNPICPCQDTWLARRYVDSLGERNLLDESDPGLQWLHAMRQSCTWSFYMLAKLLLHV